MIKNNDDSVYIGHIKQLLKDFNLPKCKIYKEELGDKQLVPGIHYIKDDILYYCNDNKELERITVYRYGEDILNITTNLQVSNGIYDSLTHRYLGRYLRFLKDYKGVDLMPLYNCCDKTVASRVSINFKYGDKTITFDANDTSSKIYMIPVRFFEDYTIGIDCSAYIEMVACICVMDVNEYLIESLDETLVQQLYADTYEASAGISLNKPFLYSKLKNINPTEELLRQESNLVLFIKVPSYAEASLVVVEGDYTITGKKNIITGNLEDANILSYYPETEDGREDLKTEVNYGTSLSLFSYLNSTAFGIISERLLEYLSLNAICPLSMDYDITKAQKELIRKGLVDSDYLGLWSDKDRLGVYKFLLQKQLLADNYDLLSYIDKDVEESLGGIL